MATDYSVLSREELIARLQALESKSTSQTTTQHETCNQNDNTRKRAGSPLSAPSKKEAKKKRERVFDFSKHSKRHIALKILYLGWDYHGLAAQADVEETIEAHVFAALTKACLIQSRETSNYQRSGRTDKGVSAFCQVLSITVRSNLTEGVGVIPPENSNGSAPANKEELPYVRTLNSLLPPEIRAVAWAPVGPEFNARFSCLCRTYKYYFRRGNLDIEAMHTAALHYIGEHDYRNLCKMDVTNGVTNHIRTILSFTVHKIPGTPDSMYTPQEQIFEFEVVGRAFLWHQVRCMVAILFLVGQGLEEPEVVRHLLDVDSYPNRPYYNMAPELPLCLYQCDYDGVNWIYAPDSHTRLVEHLESQWEHHTLKATMVRRMLDSLGNVPIVPPGEAEPKPWHEVRTQLEAPFTKKHQSILGRHAVGNFEERLSKAAANKEQKATKRRQAEGLTATTLP